MYAYLLSVSAWFIYVSIIYLFKYTIYHLTVQYDKKFMEVYIWSLLTELAQMLIQFSSHNLSRMHGYYECSFGVKFCSEHAKFFLQLLYFLVF